MTTTPGTEKRQAARLALALAALMLLVPILAAGLTALGIFLLEFIFGGWHAATSAANNWTVPSPHLPDPLFKLGLLLIAGAGCGLPVLGWYRLFVASGYVSQRTQQALEKGHVPVLGPYLLKPIGYLLFVILGAWGAWVAYLESSVLAMCFFASGSAWCALRARRELAAWFSRPRPWPLD